MTPHVDAPISLPAGTQLNHGRYCILHELNRGATAVVYAARDATSGQHVALKVMNCASQGASQVPVKVVKREIAFSTGVSHDNIVKLLDVFAEKTQLVIVWELISGPDLLDLLNEHHGTLPEGLAAFYFCQLLKAVMFMHDNGFCHRDIKPENAMVQRHNHQLKLIDFGLSKHLESARTRGVGTPDYLAPEMLTVWNVGMHGAMMGGPAPYDARAVDAWALGVLMFLLVTGKYPFEDPNHPNNLPHTIQNVLAGRMRPFPPHMSPGCRRLITNLLRIDPTQRTTLRDLTRDQWLISNACTCASQLGRLDLLAGLQPPPVPEPAGASSCPDVDMTATLPPVSAPVPSTARVALSAVTPTSHPSLPQQAGQGMGPESAGTGMQQQYPQQGALALPPHPAVLQGWPTGQVVATYPTTEDDYTPKAKDTLWQRLKRKLA